MNDYILSMTKYVDYRYSMRLLVMLQNISWAIYGMDPFQNRRNRF